jgi:pSer/pThr/pTyr-binding forkhead associated (FHA) protein
MNQSPLIHIIESGQTARIVELRGATTLGRDNDNDIVIDELTISRCHAVLLVRPQGIVLVDLDSTNGNGQHSLCTTLRTASPASATRAWATA